MWARRVKEKEWTNEFGQCGAIQPNDQGATNKTPRNHKIYELTKPQKCNEHTPINQAGNELTKKGTQAIHISNANH